VKPASQLAPRALGKLPWPHGAGGCEAPSGISEPPRFRGKPRSDPSLFVKGFWDGFVGARIGAIDGALVVGVGSMAGPGVACAEAPVVRTFCRSRRLVESFPELPSRACQLRRAASATRRR
jgi:hypothetical protein